MLQLVVLHLLLLMLLLLPLFLLTSLLLSALAKMAERAFLTILATLCVQEGAGLAIAKPVVSRAHGRHVRRAELRLREGVGQGDFLSVRSCSWCLWRWWDLRLLKCWGQLRRRRRRPRRGRRRGRPSAQTVEARHLGGFEAVIYFTLGSWSLRRFKARGQRRPRIPCGQAFESRPRLFSRAARRRRRAGAKRREAFGTLLRQ
mmetsp:Transcript_53175/g.134333  ORF Transcript_53175/g.134333 Transcript_53175/m.134333 type:complete len:202 (+) Transcript_53175:444-1049(+)